MKLTINGDEREVADALTIAGLLGELRIADQPVAVEVNGAVAPKSQHTEHALADGDVLEIVTFVGGG